MNIQNIDIQNKLKICGHSTLCLANNNINCTCLPNYTSSDTIYKELNYRNIGPICNHKANTKFKKNSFQKL
ncbi:Reverse transcriptase domain-containing protein [Aphis craccivora]|uniref:Reverse transcriptase domain-containing protein n=1 Tax=Aphis craccivora TaxID=307492 RepID=A0A6G0WBF8_APHCR|nr:Reverse transcriptase domain-containing protein [Aphis craccivora]